VPLSESAASGGAWGHPDEGAAFPDGGGAETKGRSRSPSGVWGGN